MPANRPHKKCHPRTVREFQERLTELKNEMKNWMSQPVPPADFREEWFAGMCAEPSQFTQQLISLRDALQEAGRNAEAEQEPARVRQMLAEPRP